MRDLLFKMFTGWILREQSWVAGEGPDDWGEYKRDALECYIEACGGDQIEGYLVYLFDVNGNDIQDIAPHYGIALRRRNPHTGEVMTRDQIHEWDDATPTILFIDENIEPAPSPDHWWQDGVWILPPQDDGPAESNPEHGG